MQRSHSMILPPLCFAVTVVSLMSDSLTSLTLINILLWPNASRFVWSLREPFLLNITTQFPVSTWSFWCFFFFLLILESSNHTYKKKIFYFFNFPFKSRFTLNRDADVPDLLPGHGKPEPWLFLNIWTSEGERLGFGSRSWKTSTYKPISVCTVLTKSVYRVNMADVLFA